MDDDDEARYDELPSWSVFQRLMEGQLLGVDYGSTYGSTRSPRIVKDRAPTIDLRCPSCGQALVGQTEKGLHVVRIGGQQLAGPCPAR